MCGLRERKKREMKDALAEAVAVIAAEHGIGGVAAVDVTTRVGVSTRTFHNYFSSREEAVAHHIQHIMARWPRQVRAADPEWDAVTVLLRTVYDNITDPADGELTYSDAFILSGSLGSLGNDVPHMLIMDALEETAAALSSREGHDKPHSDHALMVYAVWCAVEGAVRAARWGDNPEVAEEPMLRVSLETVEKVLRGRMVELPEEVGRRG